MDGAARRTRVRAVHGRAREPSGAGGGSRVRGGGPARRRVSCTRLRYGWRDRVGPRPAGVGSDAGAGRAGAGRVGRGGPGRDGARRRAVRGCGQERRQRPAAGARVARGRGGAAGRHLHPLMSLSFLIDRFDALPATRALADALPGAGGRRGIAGLPGSSAAVLLAALARQRAQRVFVVVTATPTDAERWLADLQALAGDAAALYPQREALGAEEPHVEIAGERIETLEALLSGRIRLLVTTARASAERTGVPAALGNTRLSLGVGPTSVGAQHAAPLRFADAVRRLEEMGYARVATVTEVAQFSVRGGILDVYGFGMASPARV